MTAEMTMAARQHCITMEPQSIIRSTDKNKRINKFLKVILAFSNELSGIKGSEIHISNFLRPQRGELQRQLRVVLVVIPWFRFLAWIPKIKRTKIVTSYQRYIFEQWSQEQKGTAHYDSVHNSCYASLCTTFMIDSWPRKGAWTNTRHIVITRDHRGHGNIKKRSGFPKYPTCGGVCWKKWTTYICYT